MTNRRTYRNPLVTLALIAGPIIGGATGYAYKSHLDSQTNHTTLSRELENVDTDKMKWTLYMSLFGLGAGLLKAGYYTMVQKGMEEMNRSTN